MSENKFPQRSRSFNQTSSAIFGALAILLGAALFLESTEASTAIGFLLSGVCLAGIAISRTRLTLAGSAITVVLAGASLFAGRMVPAAAFCFLMLSAGFVLAQTFPLARRSSILGIAGTLTAATGAVCGVSVLWGNGNVFGLGSLARMPAAAAAGFLLLGFGAVVPAVGLSLAQFRQPLWATLGAGIFLATLRIALLQAFSPKNLTGVSIILSWLGALVGAVIFGVFVHFAFKTYLQRQRLEIVNCRLEEEMLERMRAEEAAHAGNEQLEQRVEDRTRELEAANAELRREISRRERVEEDLRQQKEILETIFDHIPVLINFVDRNQQLKLVNREWETILGWSVEEILKQKIDIVEENYPDPEYRSVVREFIAQATGEWTDFKTTVRDGRVVDISWAMLRLSDGTGIGIGQNVTRRKRAEEALRESEERFRQLAENIQDLFWIKTPDFKRVLYLSPVYQSMSGRSPEQRYADDDDGVFLERIFPEDREKMAEIIRTGAESGFEIEFRIQHPDGTLRWIHDRGFPIRNQSGEVYRIAGIAHDITERKIAEAALRESEERFRQLAENIREVFWLRSPDFKQVLYVSPMYERVCGRSCESLDAAGADLVGIHPEDRAWLIEKLGSLAGREFELEYRIITKDGEVRWVRDRGFPIRNAAGEIYRIGGVAEDITERKEAADRLKGSSEQLRALSASLQSAREHEATRIARQIHDEMGGLLTGLRWELEALEKTLLGPADSGDLKLEVRSKLATMLGLTDSTINVVRSIASELRPSILDDLGLMEAVEWQTQQFQTRTGIPCRCDCTLQTIGLGSEQSTAVFRILQEALTNILRHAQATRIRVAMREEDRIFVLTVTDNGRGITEAERFSRKSLGLLGMQERGHLIGGSVDIVGRKGVGTTLELRVPLAITGTEARI